MNFKHFLTLVMWVLTSLLLTNCREIDRTILDIDPDEAKILQEFEDLGPAHRERISPDGEPWREIITLFDLRLQRNG